MAQANHTPRLAHTEEALTVLFCLIDDAYGLLNPHARRYESLKRLSDSEVIALALFQQLRGVESERSFLRDTERFFSHLFPGVVGLHPSSFHRRVRKLRRFPELLRRDVLSEMGRRPRDIARRLDFAFGFAPQAGSSELGVSRRRVGKVGLLQRLRREAPLALRHQRGPYLLRAYPRQCGGRLPDRRAHQRGETGLRDGSQALGRFGLPQRAAE